MKRSSVRRNQKRQTRAKRAAIRERRRGTKGRPNNHVPGPSAAASPGEAGRRSGNGRVRLESLEPRLYLSGDGLAESVYGPFLPDPLDADTALFNDLSDGNKRSRDYKWPDSSIDILLFLQRDFIKVFNC